MASVLEDISISTLPAHMSEHWKAMRKSLGVQLGLARKDQKVFHKKMHQYMIKRSNATGWSADYYINFRKKEYIIWLRWTTALDAIASLVRSIRIVETIQNLTATATLILV